MNLPVYVYSHAKTLPTTTDTPDWMTSYCGHDAYFHWTAEDGKTAYFGIADGVGEWEEDGINPTKFTWLFMNLCKEMCIENHAGIDCREIIQNAYNQLLEEIMADEHGSSLDCQGSCTALVARLDLENMQLQVANLGDSCLKVIRKFSVTPEVNESAIANSAPHWVVSDIAEINQRCFNCPMQLGYVCCEPEEMEEYAEEVENNISLKTCKIRVGESLIIATDGLSDALYDSDIDDCFTSVVGDSSTNVDVKKIAEELVFHAAYRQRSLKRSTPFSDAFNAKAKAELRRGGKEDDTTVIVVSIGGQDFVKDSEISQKDLRDRVKKALAME